MTPTPGEFILKERNGQPSDDQVEMDSNRSNIQKLLTENETTYKEGLGTGLCQAREVGVELPPTLGESLSSTKRHNVAHRTRDKKGQRYQNVEQELTRCSGDPKVEQTPQRESHRY